MYFNFESNYDVLKSKYPCILLNKDINFNKNETEMKMENLTHSFRDRSSHQRCSLIKGVLRNFSKFTRKHLFTEHLRATVSIKRRTMCFSAYKNRISKVKLWRVGTHERKTRTIFCTVYFVIFLYRLFVLFQCIEYWIHFQNIDTFAYQKTLFQTLFCSSNSLQCILKHYSVVPIKWLYILELL